jgi:hypothetical protein
VALEMVIVSEEEMCSKSVIAAQLTCFQWRRHYNHYGHKSCETLCSIPNRLSNPNIGPYYRLQFIMHPPYMVIIINRFPLSFV